MKFISLISEISQINQATKSQAVKAVNKSLTLRNWLVGAYIVEYEQCGEERAEYGTKLLVSIAESIDEKGFSERNLATYRTFYRLYPHLKDSPSFEQLWKIIENTRIPLSMTAKLQNANNQIITIPLSLTAEFTYENNIYINPEKLVTNLSFTHIQELFKFDDPYKRAYYELEAIQGAWSVRQLRRQIGTLYYEGSAMSKKPDVLRKLTRESMVSISSTDLLKDVFVMEFLDLPTQMVVNESDLEKTLLNNIECFLLELGHGFCFEARQKKILIGDEYFFIDLVFYHRILKCHVLVELKVENFSHHNAGQLNTYINYFKDKITQVDDNPPIGILLVADKNNALVEYATGGLDEQLFVKKYMIELPQTEELKAIIEKEIK